MTREEAIKTIRLTCPKISDSECDFETAMRFLIPELRESEDERIKKIITDSVFYQYGAGVEYKDVLDYLDKLEKQKEQRLLSVSAASEWLRKHVCNYMNSEYNEFHQCAEYDGSIDKEKLINDFEKAMQKESLRDFIDDFPYSDEQKEQQQEKKEVKFVLPKFLYARTTNNKTIDVSYAPQSLDAVEYIRSDYLHQEQKPAWSEEDKKKIGRLRSVVNQLASYTDSLDVNGDYCEGDYAELDAWLKLLPLKRKIDGFTIEEFSAISRAIELLYGSHFEIVPPLKDILTKMAKYDKGTI